MSHEVIAFSYRKNSLGDRDIKREASFKEKDLNKKSNLLKSTKNTRILPEYTDQLIACPKCKKHKSLRCSAKYQMQKVGSKIKITQEKPLTRKRLSFSHQGAN